MNEKGDRLDIVIKQVFERMKEQSEKPRSCPDDQVLAAYHEGRLTEEETEKVEAHLAICEGCTENIMLLSEVKSSFDSSEEPLLTKEMVQRAKDLMHPVLEKSSLGERVCQWFSAFRPLPAFATAFAALLLIFSVYSLYIPSDRNKAKPGLISLAIIARVPSGGVTRGKTPVYKESELREGSVLRSGDRFRIRFGVREGAYVCLLALNSQGDWTKLLPENAISSVFKADPGVTYFVPRDDDWFQLDDNRGMERIYLMASAEPIRDIDQKIVQLKKSGIDEIVSIFPGLKIQSFAFQHE